MSLSSIPYISDTLTDRFLPDRTDILDLECDWYETTIRDEDDRHKSMQSYDLSDRPKNVRAISCGYPSTVQGACNPNHSILRSESSGLLS